MSDNYTRDSRSDLSGLSPQEALNYLKPHYKTDEDLSVENVKWFLGVPLLVVVFVVCVVGSIWALLTLF